MGSVAVKHQGVIYPGDFCVGPLQKKLINKSQKKEEFLIKIKTANTDFRVIQLLINGRAFLTFLNE